MCSAREGGERKCRVRRIAASLQIWGLALVVSATGIVATVPAGAQAPVPTSRAAEPAASVVGTIDFAGLQNVKEDYLRESLALKPGGKFTAGQLETDRKALLAMGYFRSVGASQRTTNGSTEVTFRIAEWPRVAHLRVLGNTVIDTAAVREVISTQVGQVFCTTQLKDDIRAIEQLYRERGYVARISDKLLDEATRSGILRFEILELRIEDVRVEGVTEGLGQKCRKVLGQLPQELYRPELVSLDRQRLLRVRGVRTAIPHVDVTSPGKVRIRWLLNPPAETQGKMPSEG